MCLNLCCSNQPGHKIYLNMCLRNHLHPSVDSKRISTCVDQTHPMPAWTQNASQHVLTIHLPYQWRSPSENVLTKSYQASEDKKCISTYVYQSPPMTARRRNAAQQTVDYTPPTPATKKISSQLVLTQTHLMPARKKNLSQNVLT
jgi:hypothetical protein